MEPIIGIFIILYSSILHEIAHGYIAYRFGDPTAKLRGRITLNPVSHIDPFMSILMPIMTAYASHGLFIFGGAKPVPVDPFNMRDGIKDLAIVSLAGPLTNILLAVSASIIFHLFFPGSPFTETLNGGFIQFFLCKVVEWNLLLAIFNLIPIPPLDGSKILALLLPKKEAALFLSFGSSTMGMLLLFILLFSPIGIMSLVGSLINFSLSLLGF